MDYYCNPDRVKCETEIEKILDCRHIVESVCSNNYFENHLKIKKQMECGHIID